jgi:transposase
VVVINNYMKNKHANKYDWNIIQKEYDNGLSYRNLTAKFGVGSQSIANAVKRGDLKTRSLSEAGKLYYKDNPASVMGKDARERLSKRMSENNPGGKSKWFELDGKKVQGTWELNFAIHCNENNIEWTRCKPWKYVMDGKTRNYTPDFHIPSKDLYIEIKGRWWGEDRRKMDCVIEQHPDKNILIIEKEQYNQLMEGELVW